MKALILAAGYAIRMYPLTRHRAKPLLPVGGRPIIDHIIERVAEVEQINDVVLVTNHKFYDQFTEWADGCNFGINLHILDDGTSSEEGRRGAIGDIQFALTQLASPPCPGLPSDDFSDLLVLAGDNVFTFGLQDMVDFFRKRATDVFGVYRQIDVERLRRSGVAILDRDGRVAAFAEKPEEPATQWAAPPIYAYTRDTLDEVERYLAEGNNPDAPGHFVTWICKRRPVYAFSLAEAPYDVGNLDSYRDVNRLFSSLAAATATEVGAHCDD